MRLVVGISSSVSRTKVFCVRTFRLSTTGVSPKTVTVSSTCPTFISALIVAVNDVVNSTPSRLKVLKPGSENVTV